MYFICYLVYYLLSFVCLSLSLTLLFFFFFFFTDTAPTEIYTLSLHDALPISHSRFEWPGLPVRSFRWTARSGRESCSAGRSEEHTSELQSLTNLVCRLLLEKKKKKKNKKKHRTQQKHQRTVIAPSAPHTPHNN